MKTNIRKIYCKIDHVQNIKLVIFHSCLEIESSLKSNYISNIIFHLCSLGVGRASTVCDDIRSRPPPPAWPLSASTDSAAWPMSALSVSVLSARSGDSDVVNYPWERSDETLKWYQRIKKTRTKLFVISTANKM